MNRPEVAQLLTVIATLDRRTLGEADVIAWHGTLGDLLFEECRDAAVQHYAEQTEWLMPAHIRRRVTARRNDQAARRPVLEAPVRATSPGPEWYAVKAQLAAKVRKGGSGPSTLGDSLAALAETVEQRAVES